MTFSVTVNTRTTSVSISQTGTQGPPGEGAPVFGFYLDGQGASIEDRTFLFVVPRNATIQSIKAVADQAGDLDIVVQKYESPSNSSLGSATPMVTLNNFLNEGDGDIYKVATTSAWSDNTVDENDVLSVSVSNITNIRLLNLMLKTEVP